MKKSIKQQLKENAQNAPVPAVLHTVKEGDILAYKTNDSGIVPQAQPKKRLGWAVAAAGAAMVLLFVLMLPLFQKTDFDTAVFATVNVSVQGKANYVIDINKGTEVIDMTADTTEGNGLIQYLSFKQKKLEQALTDLLIACVDAWDMNETDIANVTVTVDCHDQAKKEQIGHHINNSVKAAKTHCQNKHGGGHHGK